MFFEAALPVTARQLPPSTATEPKVVSSYDYPPRDGSGDGGKDPENKQVKYHLKISPKRLTTAVPQVPKTMAQRRPLRVSRRPFVRSIAFHINFLSSGVTAPAIPPG